MSTTPKLRPVYKETRPSGLGPGVTGSYLSERTGCIPTRNSPGAVGEFSSPHEIPLLRCCTWSIRKGTTIVEEKVSLHLPQHGHLVSRCSLLNRVKIGNDLPRVSPSTVVLSFRIIRRVEPSPQEII